MYEDSDDDILPSAPETKPEPSESEEENTANFPVEIPAYDSIDNALAKLEKENKERENVKHQASVNLKGKGAEIFKKQSYRMDKFTLEQNKAKSAEFMKMESSSQFTSVTNTQDHQTAISSGQPNDPAMDLLTAATRSFNYNFETATAEPVNNQPVKSGPTTNFHRKDTSDLWGKNLDDEGNIIALEQKKADLYQKEWEREEPKHVPTTPKTPMNYGTSGGIDSGLLTTDIRNQISSLNTSNLNGYQAPNATPATAGMQKEAKFVFDSKTVESKGSLSFT